MKPYYDEDGITIYHGDCREVLPLLSAVDHVITDPPYSEHVHSRSRAGNSLADIRRGEVSRAREFGFEALSADLRGLVTKEVARICARWVLTFSDMESAHLWREDYEDHELEYVRTGLWIKLNGAPQFTGDRPAVGAEAITIMHRPGRKAWNGGGSLGVWTYPIVINRGGQDPRLHTAQKPLGLMKRLIGLFTDPNDLVLDLFMGSGTTLRAAKDLGRRSIGIELDERYCEIAARRLSQAVFDFADATP